MANDIYLVFFDKVNDNTPVLKGESTLQGRAGAIRARSLTWGYDQHPSVGSSSGGAGAGRAEFGEMVFTKAVDAVSPAIYQALAMGTVYPKVVVSIRKGAGDLAAFTLGTVVFSSVKGSASEDDATEDIGIMYGKVVWQAAKADGRLPTPAFGWNRVKNAPTVDVGS